MFRLRLGKNDYKDGNLAVSNFGNLLSTKIYKHFGWELDLPAFPNRRQLTLLWLWNKLTHFMMTKIYDFFIVLTLLHSTYKKGQTRLSRGVGVCWRAQPSWPQQRLFLGKHKSRSNNHDQPAKLFYSGGFSLANNDQGVEVGWGGG